VLALSKAANRDPKNSAVWLALAEAQRALRTMPKRARHCNGQ